MKYQLKVYSIWECGQRVDSEGNPHQEDNIFPAYEQQNNSDRLFILCDGMGGHEAGEVASSTVCSAMSTSVFESVPDSEGDFTDDDLRKAINDAFNALDALPLGDVSAEKKMGTTMTFLKFHNKGCTIAHMGDSRVYHIRPGKGREDTKILFKTNDHSLVNDLIKVGELTPEEAKQSKQKNIITRAMQPKMERRPKPDVYHTVDIKAGDYFYMCSDGMLEQMEDDNLLFNFSEATGADENKVDILTQATSQNLDNHSAIIIHVLEVIDPLPIESAPVIPTVNKPVPIMAEIEEASHDENNEEENRETKNTLVEQSTEKESLILENVEMSRLDNDRQNDASKKQNEKNKRLIKYISLALLITLLAFGIYIVSSLLTDSPVKEPEKTEISQEPNKKAEKKQHPYGSGKNSPQQSIEEPNDSPELNNSNSSTESGASANTSNSTVPNKQNDAFSSQASQSLENGESAGHVNSTGGYNHNNIPKVNINQVNRHGENVVSSDQQVAIDAANKEKKAP